MFLYHLITRKKSGEIVYLTSYAMAHNKCLTMRARFTNPARIELLQC